MTGCQKYLPKRPSLEAVMPGRDEGADDQRSWI